jgi:hypothetical protein
VQETGVNRDRDAKAREKHKEDNEGDKIVLPPDVTINGLSR